MPSGQHPADPEDFPRQQVEAVAQRLEAFYAIYEEREVRDRVRELAEILKSLRTLNVAVARATINDERGARARILAYLQMYCGEVIDGIELEVVGGISEYARRVRELRLEQGYPILTSVSNDPDAGVALGEEQYLLLRPEPAEDAAARWQTMKTIRNRPVSVQQRILELFQAYLGQILTSEDLAYVAKDKTEWGRRVRELRTEQGWEIATNLTGRPDLRQGEYILLTLDRAKPHDRRIPMAVQRAVYARDRNTCRRCGWSWALFEAEPRRLELHHVEMHRDRGPNTVDNLVVLCNVCHDAVHAGEPLDLLPNRLRGDS